MFKCNFWKSVLKTKARLKRQIEPFCHSVENQQFVFEVSVVKHITNEALEFSKKCEPNVKQIEFICELFHFLSLSVTSIY